MTSDLAEDTTHNQTPRLVNVIFNTKSIRLPQGELTGAEIKAHAIEEGIDIQPDFVLAVRRGNRFESVGDGDEVKVHPNMVFTALAGDDNS